MRSYLLLLFGLAFASAAGAESFSGTLPFSSDGHVGELQFTALAPGETSSGYGVFASSGYGQAADASNYTYLYYLQNDSAAGTPTSFCDEQCFFGLDIDLEALGDPVDLGISSVGFDASNGGEAPSDAFADSGFDVVSYFFDDPPNYGILPEGGFSAILRFYSPNAPSSAGGAYVTSNTFDSENTEYEFVHFASGVTAPVPEPGTGLLVAGGLLGLAARRRLPQTLGR